jgi:hypothetical protein
MRGPANNSIAEAQAETQTQTQTQTEGYQMVGGPAKSPTAEGSAR